MKILISFLLISTLAAQANSKDFEPSTVQILCEYGLAGFPVDASLKLHQDKTFGRIFQFLRSHDVNQRALVKMGLPLAKNKPVFDDFYASIFRSTFRHEPKVKASLYRLEPRRPQIEMSIFQNEDPYYWHQFDVFAEDLQLPSEDFHAKYRPVNSSPASIGYVDEFDGEGIRRYVSFEKQTEVTFGLDVPCERISEFTNVPREQIVVTEPGFFVCRIPVLSFAREDDTKLSLK